MPAIVYADAHLLVVHKPSGLLSVPGRLARHKDCVATRVQQRYADARIVHRLDMATSGLMVLARSADSQRVLSMAFAQRRVHKRYVAVVQGHVTPPVMVHGADADMDADADSGWHTIDAPLIVDWPNRPRSKIDHAIGKPSQTRWRCVAQPHAHPALLPEVYRPTAPHTVLDLEPVTGRSHQLRVHLQSIGHPIAGDTLYGDAANQAMSPRLLLHAYALALPHPATGQLMHWLCPTRFEIWGDGALLY